MTVNMITIRPATAEDAGLIADMSRQTFYDTFAAQNNKEDMDKFLQEQFTREMLIAEVDAPGNLFLLAYEGQRPVGYARLRDNNNPPELSGKNTLEIARIYAIKESIGKGVGSALMEECISEARKRGKEMVWLGVWQENKRAIAFYERWGFEIFASHDFILGNDVQKDWLMKRNL